MSAQLPQGAWVRPGFEVPFRPDTVVLDVDGVLVDVRRSFREVIRLTAAAMQRLMGASAVWTPSHDDIARLKRAGGFNDDVDVSIAMTAIGAAGRGAEVAAIAAAVTEGGAGLRGLRVAAPDLPDVSGALTLRVFNEHYWGRRAYRRAFGEEPVHVEVEEGLVEREQPLVKPDLPARLRSLGVAHVAVVTGRTPTELEVALELIGWSRDVLAATVTGDMVRKPDPGCLDLVVERCGARSLLFVGDVRDDWGLVERYRDERTDGVDARCVLVGDDEEMEVYRGMGVDATVRATPDMLALLSTWGG